MEIFREFSIISPEKIFLWNGKYGFSTFLPFYRFWGGALRFSFFLIKLKNKEKTP